MFVEDSKKVIQIYVRGKISFWKILHWKQLSHEKHMLKHRNLSNLPMLKQTH